jgi:ABC-type lipoprotein export system ATPase subunit
VARALVTGAALLIADEPSGNLDRHTAEQLHELLGNITVKGERAVVVATHNPDLARRADAIYTLRDGRLHRGDVRLTATGDIGSQGVLP